MITRLSPSGPYSEAPLPPMSKSTPKKSSLAATVWSSVSWLRNKRLMKRAVLVVTDGFPVGDTVSPKTVIERANAAEVSVFVVTLPSFSRVMASSTQTPLPTPLDVSGLAELTGGRNVYAYERDYAPLFRALAEEVSSAYVIAFYPPEEKRRDGKIHTIRVEGPRGLTLRQSRIGISGGGQVASAPDFRLRAGLPIAD